MARLDYSPLARHPANTPPGRELSQTVTSLLKKLMRTRPAGLAIAAMLAVVSLADPQLAAAQGRLEAEYSATLAGIPIGRGSWIIDISDDEFSASADGAIAGLLRVFTSGTGTSFAHGAIAGGRPVPMSYAATMTTKDKIDDVRMAFAGGNVKDFTVEPPVGPNPERVPVTDADRRNVFDPMTSSMNFVGGGGEPLSPQACNRKMPVFDGRVRYDLSSEFKRVEIVKAPKGYQGPVMVCAVYFTPISGYIPSSAIIKYLTAVRDAEAWIAPIAGTRVLVPFRFSLPTPLGIGAVQATQFVTIAKPPRAAANVKVQ
jgi:hypothetical protein